MDFSFRKNKITYILFAVNVVVWIVLEIIGNTQDALFMIDFGAMQPYCALIQRQYYRFFTSIFLHFGIMHLFNNMLLLIVAGRYLERALGSLRYLIVYILSGAAGSGMSCLYMIYKGSFDTSAGASGAIFGIVGGLLSIIIVHRGRYAGLSVRGILVMIALLFYNGLTADNVDNAAHLGGFVVGAILTLLIYKIKIFRQKRIA